MPGRRARLAATAAAGLLASAVVALTIHPFGPTTIDPDAAASVVYFQRIAAGQRLEAFVPTTPKAFLTLLYGLSWGFAHDWRALTWETIGAFGIAVSLAVAWASRLGVVVAGRSAVGGLAGVAAAAFLAAGLAASPDLALEVSRANSLVWALAAWLVAALAMTGPRTRPALAGLALLVGGLLRFETLAIVAAAAAVLVGRELAARLGRGSPPGRGSWLVLIGLLAVPVACLHDALLTGDPLFWASVATRYTELYAPTAALLGPIDVARTLVARLGSEWGIAALAAVGVVGLAGRRAWSALVGLAGLGGGVVVLLLVLAARGTYISGRYYEPLDLVLLALASVGAATLVSIGTATLGARIPDRWSNGARADGEVGPGAGSGSESPADRVGGLAAALAACILGALAAVALAWPAAPFDRAVATSLELVRASSANIATYGARLGDLAGGRAAPPSPGPVGAPSVDASRVTLFVPSLLRSRVAVETGASLVVLGDTYAAFLHDPPWAGLHAGQHLYHDAAADRPGSLDRALEGDPVRLGDAVGRVELVDGSAGVRILTIVAP